MDVDLVNKKWKQKKKEYKGKRKKTRERGLLHLCSLDGGRGITRNRGKQHKIGKRGRVKKWRYMGKDTAPATKILAVRTKDMAISTPPPLSLPLQTYPRIMFSCS